MPRPGECLGFGRGENCRRGVLTMPVVPLLRGEARLSRRMCTMPCIMLIGGGPSLSLSSWRAPFLSTPSLMSNVKAVNKTGPCFRSGGVKFFGGALPGVPPAGEPILADAAATTDPR